MSDVARRCRPRSAFAAPTRSTPWRTIERARPEELAAAVRGQDQELICPIRPDQVAVAVLVEVERDPVEVEVVVVAAFDAGRLRRARSSPTPTGARALVQLGELGVVGSSMHTDHQPVADEPDRVVVGVEVLDDLAGLVARVGDRVQARCRRRHETASDELIVGRTPRPAPSTGRPERRAGRSARAGSCRSGPA